ncbi:serine hydrolase [Brevibacillus sp. 179-C9.3 HS]|uniref:serine hydrolase n=1 Tax=unclassified Brevibacillus TaxID=2684853 RepID=UPI00399F0CE3
MSNEMIRSEIENKLKEKVAIDPKLHNVYLLIHSEKLDIHWPMAAGSIDGVAANPNQPYHTASVGKTFTAVILSMLVEQGLVKFEDSIANYLPSEIVKDLHVLKGKDHAHDIKIKHLLNNTSGLPDFFEEKPKRGKDFWKRYWSIPRVFGRHKKRFIGQKSTYNLALLPEHVFIIRTRDTTS